MQKPKVPKSVRPVSSRWMPELWASPNPFGWCDLHSNNFWEVFRAIWENLDLLPYAYRILNDGVCDGCSLGTREFWASVEPVAAGAESVSIPTKSEAVLRP
jgi:hypothetical protein